MNDYLQKCHRKQRIFVVNEWKGKDLSSTLARSLIRQNAFELLEPIMPAAELNYIRQHDIRKYLI